MIGLGLARVTGRSMEPTLHEGDTMLVLRGAPPRTGGLAIVRLPPDDAGMPRPLAIKRVTRRDPDDPEKYWVESDNQAAEGVADSWRVGSLSRDQIQGLVLFRLPTARVVSRHVGVAAFFWLRSRAKRRGRGAGS